MSDMKRVKYVELNDFRAFKGKMPFDFTTQTGEVADFVAIYAPNGSGKTSFFDAIEWGLTGKINRLENDIGNNKYEGYILKNRDSLSEIANVEIVLEDEKSVHRKTKQITKNQLKDYAAGYKKADDDEVFKFSNWESLILPHNRIESFVKDGTGAKKYEDWGSFWDPTGEERKEFEFLYKMKKQASIMVGNLNLEIQENESKLDRFKGTSEIICNVNKYIQNYNKVVSRNEKVGYFSLDFSSEDYSLFINEIEVKKKNIETKNLKFENSLSDLNLLNDDFIKSFVYSEKDLNRHKYLFQSWTTILLKANDKMSYVNQFNSIKEKIFIKAQILEQIFELFNAGEDWFEKYLNYENIKLFINSMIEKRGEFENQLRYFEEQRKKTNDRKDTFIAESNLEEKKCKLNEYVNYLNAIKRKLKRNEKWLKRFFEINSNIEKNINLLETMQLETKNSIIEDINEFSLVQIAMITIEIKNKDSIIKKLEDLINVKEDIVKKCLVERVSYETAEKLSEELSEIIKVARLYINKQNSRNCPVCNKEYESEEALLSKTNVTNNDTVNIHLKQWNQYESDLKKINSEIEKVVLDWNDKVKLFLEEISKTIINDTKKKNRVKLIKCEIEKNELKNRKIYESYLENSKKLGYYDLELSQELIEKWYVKESDKNSQNLKELDDTLKDLDKDIEKTKDALDTLKNEYNLKKEESEHFENIPLNLKFIDLIRKNNLGQNMMKIKDKIDNITNENSILAQEQNRVCKKLELLKWVDNNKISYYEYKVKSFDAILKDKIQIYKDNCDKLRNITGSIIPKKSKIMNKKRKLRRYIELNNIKIDSISNIEFSGEIQEYLNSKVKIEKNLDILSKKLDKSKKTEENLDNIYLAAKKVVEDNITTVLNTPLINDFYRKIEPHPIMRNMKYSLKFNDKDKPELEVLVVSDSDKEEYTPEWYFSSAQLNVVALTTFFGRANSVHNSPIDTLFIDDPVGHFDDINILAFVDLLRAMIEKKKKQIVISTHDEVVYNLLKRKLSEKYYSSKFIELGYRD